MASELEQRPSRTVLAFRMVEQSRFMGLACNMTVQSIERAFSLLRALATGPHGVTELAESVDLPKSTVARLLGALEYEGAVSQAESGGEYRLGEGLLDLAGATQPGRNLIATVRPHLLALSEALGEAAGLSLEVEGDVYYLDHAVPDTDVQVRDWTGESLPLHSVPSGMTIMAHWPESQVAKYLSEPLVAVTPFTVVEPDAIRERLATVRSLGYAWGYEEGVDGINSVAAPIISGDASAVAAVHVHGPAFRFPNPDRIHDLGLQLVETADRISEQLDD